MPSTSSLGGRDVRDRVRERDAIRDRPARLLGGNLLVGNHHHRLHTLRRVEPRGRDAAVLVGADDEAAVERGRDVVGVPLDLGRLDEDVLGLLGQLVRDGRPRAGRRRSPPRSSRGRPRAGSRCGSGTRSRRRAAATRRRARRDWSGRGERPSPSASTENVPTSSTSSSRCMASAAASTSYPGPRLADEAGTLTSRRRAVRGSPPLDRAATLGLGCAGSRPSSTASSDSRTQVAPCDGSS